jgi:hypothetical protein
MASPALHRAKRIAACEFRSPVKLATTVAAITPIATGTRAVDPSAIMVPAERPAAGQNAATPSGAVNRARLSRAARKYATATAAARPIEIHDFRKGASTSV